MVFVIYADVDVNGNNQFSFEVHAGMRKQSMHVKVM